MRNHIEAREDGMIYSSLKGMIGPDGKNFYQIVAGKMGLRIYPEGTMQKTSNEFSDNWQIRIQNVGEIEKGEEKYQMVLVTIKDRYYEFADKLHRLERGEPLDDTEDDTDQQRTQPAITVETIEIEEKEPLPPACLEKT